MSARISSGPDRQAVRPGNVAVEPVCAIQVTSLQEDAAVRKVVVEAVDVDMAHGVQCRSGRLSGASGYSVGGMGEVLLLCGSVRRGSSNEAMLRLVEDVAGEIGAAGEAGEFSVSEGGGF